MKRCEWAGNTEMMIDYHDKEWGRPLYDDQKLFEFLILESMQAGLSWDTILKKRENFRAAFDNFDPEIIACYNEAKFDELMNNAGIIRNRLKIKAAITAAKLYLEIQTEGSFSDYIWQFVGSCPKINKWKSLKYIPAQTDESVLMSKTLKKRGFNFVGPTICYAFMQATGMVNDHIIDCFCYNEINLQAK
ncbi:MAG: DNA-3-methyladenine glycosylase I [candidate division Zixibacteria bacterium]|nr:DNA-3-methyladenine glycosylase I [candidate division Zixibacteria bacterium]